MFPKNVLLTFLYLFLLVQQKSNSTPTPHFCSVNCLCGPIGLACPPDPGQAKGTAAGQGLGCPCKPRLGCLRVQLCRPSRATRNGEQQMISAKRPGGKQTFAWAHFLVGRKPSAVLGSGSWPVLGPHQDNLKWTIDSPEDSRWTAASRSPPLAETGRSPSWLKVWSHT